MSDQFVNAVKDVVIYLLSKKLSGDEKALKSIKMYLIDNISPSEIESRLKISRHVVRGYASRVYERADGNGLRRKFIAKVLPKIFKHVDEVNEVIYVKERRFYRCKLCGKLVARYGLTQHLVIKHKNIAEPIINKILQELNLN